MASIRPTRSAISDSFPVVGFHVEVPSDRIFEVVVTSDPALLRPDRRNDRRNTNFYCSAAEGTLSAPSGAAMYLLPPSILASFAGTTRLYYALATRPRNNGGKPEIAFASADRGPWISLDAYTGRQTRRPLMLPSASRFFTPTAASMRWSGDDVAAPTLQPGNSAPVPSNSPTSAPAPAMPAAPVATAGLRNRAPSAFDYDDGFGPMPTQMDASEEVPNDRGFEGTMNDEAFGLSNARSLENASAPEYPGAAEFISAHPRSSHTPRNPRTIERVVIHVTYGRNPRARATANYIKSGAENRFASVHYVVGQGGEVVQCVPEAKVAYHASSANANSIGIEHNANPDGLLPTQAQYEASADLVAYLLRKYNIPPDRAHVLGHSEADPRTTHTGCPNSVWDWDQYMALVRARCTTTSQAQSADDADDRGIEGDINDNDDVTVGSQALESTLTSEYPAASEFILSHRKSYKTPRTPRNIERIVIHITGSSKARPARNTARYFERGSPETNEETGETKLRLVSAHYVVGRDGAVIQCVPEAKVAYHAKVANSNSIGIEHSANRREAPTRTQYEASADLVAYLIRKYNIPLDRTHVLGHIEADPSSTHTDCPNSVWDWDLYMGLLRARCGSSAAAPARAQHSLTSPEYPQASEYIEAHARAHREPSPARAIDKVVIHITAGSNKEARGTANYFKNGADARYVASHYVVGQAGEVVQCAPESHVADHAHGANQTSIGIEHCANTKNMPVTDTQYCASAALVAYLVDKYSIPCDRTHIIGHNEVPGTNKECPGNWDWDYFMEMVRTQTCFERPTRAQAQSISAALEIMTPFYDPADPSSALTCQNDAFSQQREEWFAGVPNTRIFPHSAICKLEMTGPDGSRYRGTGCYIARNRILTCAHNLHGMSRVKVIPGSNGAGDEPYGSCVVQSSGWRVAPRYTGDGNWSNDLAVIDNVPLAAPNNAWFRFLNATPSDQLPIVVCGYSTASNAVPALTQAIDGNKQHLHGGYATSQNDWDTIDYAILTLKGASGSPVYHLQQNASGNLEALITAVHVTGEPAARGLNRGCFITPAKLDWIEGRATAFSANSQSTCNCNARSAARPIARGAMFSARQFSDSQPSSSSTSSHVSPANADAIERVRNTYSQNAAAPANQRRTNSTELLNDALRAFYGSLLQSNGASPKLSTNIQSAMQDLQQRGLAADAQRFEFLDSAGAATSGDDRPDHLETPVSSWLMDQAQQSGLAGWYLFGVSLLEGNHTALIALQYSGVSNAATKIYWADHMDNWLDVTNTLDNKLTDLTLRFWDSILAHQNKRARTAATLWPLSPVPMLEPATT